MTHPTQSHDQLRVPGELDVYGVGNALVDMEYKVDDEFLAEHDVAKGLMTLVEEDRLDALTNALSELTPERASGGSAANTVYAVQALGAKAAYACKIAHDETGNHFSGAMRDAGAWVAPEAQVANGKTGRCLVLVTPDGERSMNTFLGISATIDTSALQPEVLSKAKYLYIEGYLCSGDDSRALAEACREHAEASGVRTSITLSDPSMVEFFKDNLIKIIGNGVDHIFCNEEEALAWAGTDRLEIAANELADVGKSLSITLGAKGSYIVTKDGRREVAGYPSQVVDTNGAGDIYAGASLWGWQQGMEPANAARFANYCAAHLVSRYGARLTSTAAYQALREDFASN